MFVLFQGHNTDGKYFINSNKMSFHFETSPKRVVLYIEKSKDGHVTPIDGVQIVDFACGNNHTVIEFAFIFIFVLHKFHRRFHQKKNPFYMKFIFHIFVLFECVGCNRFQETCIFVGIWWFWSFGPCRTKRRNGTSYYFFSLD